MQWHSFLCSIIGLSTKPTFVLGRPLPPGLKGYTAESVVHDRRLSAGIFSQTSRAKSKAKLYRLVVWKAYQEPGGRWRVSTSLFADEIDPALGLTLEARRRLNGA